jgi:hypothetical protein
MFMGKTPSFVQDRTASSYTDSLHGRNKKGGQSPPKKQAPERFNQTLRRMTHKPTQLSQANELCADNKKWRSGNEMRAFLHAQTLKMA